MKSNMATISNNFIESKENTTNDLFSLNERESLIVNAGSGLFILFSLFALFTLFSLLLLFVLGLEVNILPVVVAIMLTAAVAITVFVLSHVIEMIIELRNNGE